MRACVDCRWFKQYGYPPYAANSAPGRAPFPSLTEECEVSTGDLVYGTGKLPARVMRQPGYPCGVDGKLWQEKEDKDA